VFSFCSILRYKNSTSSEFHRTHFPYPLPILSVVNKERPRCRSFLLRGALEAHRAVHPEDREKTCAALRMMVSDFP
jgi:hypothetical protein